MESKKQLRQFEEIHSMVKLTLVIVSATFVVLVGHIMLAHADEFDTNVVRYEGTDESVIPCTEDSVKNTKLCKDGALYFPVSEMFVFKVMSHAAVSLTSNGDILITQDDGTENFTIKVSEKQKTITIKTRNSTFRIHDCGRVEKLEWKELNPNEDGLLINRTDTSPTYEFRLGEPNIYLPNDNHLITPVPNTLGLNDYNNLDG